MFPEFSSLYFLLFPYLLLLNQPVLSRGELTGGRDTSMNGPALLHNTGPCVSWSQQEEEEEEVVWWSARRWKFLCRGGFSPSALGGVFKHRCLRRHTHTHTHTISEWKINPPPPSLLFFLIILLLSLLLQLSDALKQEECDRRSLPSFTSCSSSSSRDTHAGPAPVSLDGENRLKKGVRRSWSPPPPPPSTLLHQKKTPGKKCVHTRAICASTAPLPHSSKRITQHATCTLPLTLSFVSVWWISCVCECGLVMGWHSVSSSADDQEPVRVCDWTDAQGSFTGPAAVCRRLWR